MIYIFYDRLDFSEIILIACNLIQVKIFSSILRREVSLILYSLYKLILYSVGCFNDVRYSLSLCSIDSFSPSVIFITGKHSSYIFFRNSWGKMCVALLIWFQIQSAFFLLSLYIVVSVMNLLFGQFCAYHWKIFRSLNLVYGKWYTDPWYQFSIFHSLDDHWHYNYLRIYYRQG